MGALETYFPTLSKTGSYPEVLAINLPDGSSGTPRLQAPDETSRFRLLYREGGDLGRRN